MGTHSDIAVEIDTQPREAEVGRLLGIAEFHYSVCEIRRRLARELGGTDLRQTETYACQRCEPQHDGKQFRAGSEDFFNDYGAGEDVS